MQSIILMDTSGKEVIICCSMAVKQEKKGAMYKISRWKMVFINARREILL